MPRNLARRLVHASAAALVALGCTAALVALGCTAALVALGCTAAPEPRTGPGDALAAADALVAQGRDAEALARLERALQHAPDDPELSIRIGQIELERGNPADAYFAFKHAVGLAPDDLRAVSGWALASDALGFDREAAAAYARWAELEGEPAPSGAAGDPGTGPW